MRIIRNGNYALVSLTQVTGNPKINIGRNQEKHDKMSFAMIYLKTVERPVKPHQRMDNI